VTLSLLLVSGVLLWWLLQPEPEQAALPSGSEEDEDFGHEAHEEIRTTIGYGLEGPEDFCPHDRACDNIHDCLLTQKIEEAAREAEESENS
jgi:hypothetical protein